MKHIISACFFLFSLSVVSQNVTVAVDKTVTLKELFKQIENKPTIRFLHRQKRGVREKKHGY